MSGKESTGHDLASMIKTNPLIAPPKDEHSNAKHEKESGDFDNDEIQKKMSGLIHNLQSGSPDHDQSHKTSTKVDVERTRSPVAEKHAERPSRATSPQGSKNHETSKIRKSSAGSSGDDEKKKKKETKRDSSDEHHRKSSKSPKPEMKHDSSQTKHDTTVKTDAHKNARHSSTESDDLPRSTSKKTPAKHSPRDNDKRSPSPESKKEHLNNSKASKKEQPKPTHTTDDDKTDDEHHASKSKKKPTNDEHHKTAGEDTDLKKTHSIQDLVSKSIRPSADPHSDTEQAKPKRRRPKRISRTTQTYEHIFRRMERDEHEELVPTNDTDKNCQTRKSQLSPQKQRSSKKSYSIYISSDDYKIEPVNSKKSSSDQRNPSNTRKPAPETGKLLILRPAQSGHRSNAVNTQRITSEQAIDLIRNDKKQDSTSAGQRTKSKTRKQPEHAQKLPRVNSPASSTGHDHHPQKANPKGKTKHDSDDDPF